MKKVIGLQEKGDQTDESLDWAQFSEPTSSYKDLNPYLFPKPPCQDSTMSLCTSDMVLNMASPTSCPISVHAKTSSVSPSSSQVQKQLERLNRNKDPDYVSPRLLRACVPVWNSYVGFYSTFKIVFKFNKMIIHIYSSHVNIKSSQTCVFISLRTLYKFIMQVPVLVFCVHAVYIFISVHWSAYCCLLLNGIKKHQLKTNWFICISECILNSVFTI